MHTSDLKLVKKGFRKRASKTEPRINRSVMKVKCSVCRVGYQWRYSDGKFSKCNKCGASGMLPKKK